MAMTMTMEVCTLRLVSDLLPIHSPPRHVHSFPCSTSPSAHRNIRFASGLRRCVNSPPGGTSTETQSYDVAKTKPFFADDEPDKVKSFFGDDEPVTDEVITTTSGDTSPETELCEPTVTKTDESEIKKEEDSAVTVENTNPVSKIKDSVAQTNELPQESPVADLDLSKFLEDLGIQIDFEENKYLILALGGGGLTALWLSFAVIGAIDSIPLFPKLMELVGLGYAIWFSIRYLLFQESRGRLVAKIEELKKETLG